MRSRRIAIIVLVLLAAVFTAGAGTCETGGENSEILYIGKFSAAGTDREIPAGWEPLTFEKIDQHTRYRLVRDNETTVIKAKSDSSASGLIRKMRIDPRQYPFIQWRWKATGIYENGDVTRKSGDDYPARLYIAFEYDPEKAGFFERAKFNIIEKIYGEYPPAGVINYIWASRAAKGRIVPNAYTDRAQMIVLQSGRENTNTWVSESRNILTDYRVAFGQEPPMIQGIAIMTDSDDTGESAVTYYGDIMMKSQQ
jgi:hypothetical protein